MLERLVQSFGSSCAENCYADRSCNNRNKCGHALTIYLALILFNGFLLRIPRFRLFAPSECFRHSGLSCPGTVGFCRKNKTFTRSIFSVFWKAYSYQAASQNTFNFFMIAVSHLKTVCTSPFSTNMSKQPCVTLSPKKAITGCLSPPIFSYFAFIFSIIFIV